MTIQTLEFHKYEGLGNDFIILDGLSHNLPSLDYWTKISPVWCDRHFGIGADGIILVLPSDQADCKMKVINSDGTQTEMCGNGIRCLAHFMYVHQLVKKSDFSVQTDAGILRPKINLSGDTIINITVDMGEPILQSDLIPVSGPRTDQVINQTISTDDGDKLFCAVSMGNPHAVFFVDDLSTIDLVHDGPKLEGNPKFPNRANIEWVKVNRPDDIDLIVWERGAGRTLACGTGACASVVTGILLDKLDRRTTVTAHLPGGKLGIFWSEKDNHVFMTGPATHVFSGTISI